MSQTRPTYDGPSPIMRAYTKHFDAARAAYDLFQSWCDYPVTRIPGCSTDIRMAWRIECGMSIEQAAARELIYRATLANDQAGNNPRSCFNYLPILLGE